MPTTKPAARTKTKPQSRAAAHYRPLKRDDYAHLDPIEQKRHDLHTDIDAIIDAIEYAELDKGSIGFKANTGADSNTGGGTGVTIRHCKPCKGTGHDRNNLTCDRCHGTGHTEEESQLNSVEAWSQRHDASIDWLATKDEAIANVTIAARLARYHYGYDPDRGKDDKDRPHDRQNAVEVCAWCAQPAPDGRGDNGKILLRRIDGKPVHANPCYWALSKQALRAGTSPGAHLNNHGKEKTA